MISIFASPLQWSQNLLNGPLRHEFVIIQTDNGYWSVEKTTEAIIIQRSKELNNVLLLQKGEKRKPNFYCGKPRLTEIAFELETPKNSKI